MSPTTNRALELAGAAVKAAEADEADAVAHVEHSGFARFAASEVHQPTLIRDETVTLRVVRNGKVGCAVTNRTDGEGLREAAKRAADAADSAKADLQEGLGPEFKDFDLNDLNPKTFVRKHLLEDDGTYPTTTGKNGSSLFDDEPSYAATAGRLESDEPPPFDNEAT